MLQPPPTPGQILTGVLFNEPMRVETIRNAGPDIWVVVLVGPQSERFRNVTLSSPDLEALTILNTTASDDGDGVLLRLGLQAAEAKLSRLRALLQQEGFFDHPEQRLLLFTELRDTLDYLLQRLRGWGFQVGCIHGGMKPGSRDEPGTRLHAEQQLKDGANERRVAEDRRIATGFMS